MPSDRPTTTALARTLGTRDAVVVGLASMVGAGVFGAFTPAAREAGSWLLVSLGLAGLVAYANATSSAQLAAQDPRAGGTYVHGRTHLGPWWGFVAGWGFVVGKTASCAAMALTAAVYLVPGPAERPVAAAAVVVLGLVGYRGVTRTARVARVLVALVLAGLAVAVVVGLAAGAPDVARLAPAADDVDAAGVLGAAGLLFFAFAGYARIATLGEEVRDPRHTIPRAVAIALGLVLVVYGVVGAVLLAVLGPAGVAAAPAPLLALVGGADAPGWAAGVVRLAAGAGALGALLALLAGVSRTVLAMAREHDLPGGLAAVHPRYAVPHRAEAAVTAAVLVLVLVADLRGAIGFSSFGVLTYYLVANLAALRQAPAWRRYPRGVAVGGALGCVALAATLPTASVVGGVVVAALGVAVRAARLRAGRGGARSSG